MITRRAATAGLVGLAGAGLAPASVLATPELDDMQAATQALSREGRYLAAWPRMEANRKAENQDFRAQWAAFLGDEATALADATPKTLSPPVDLGGARAEEAIAAIVQASAGRRVVMLNEAHVASRHRMFLAEVLRALRREGFTHFAAEDFLNVRDPGAPNIETLRIGDKVTPNHGFYINDPVYAEAVREALALGYQLVRYEERPDQNGPGGLELSVPRREQSQAENMAEALGRWPNGRFLIHVGYGHLSKITDRPGGSLFAARLMKLTGIEPLTVLQASTGSFGPHGPDSPMVQAVLARFAPKAPVAVFDSKEQALGARVWAADLNVFHPSLPDVFGRPGWLAAARGRRAVKLRLPAPSPEGLALAQAVPAADADPAIPADQYLLAPRTRDLIFHLRPGRYRVRLETPDGFSSIGEVRA